MLRCADGRYYIGHTDNLEYRIGQHQSGLTGGFTHTRRPVTLVWCQDFPSRLEALEAERRVKGWTRAKKEALIAGDWARLSLLARNRQDRTSPSTGSGRTEVGAGSFVSPVALSLSKGLYRPRTANDRHPHPEMRPRRDPRRAQRRQVDARQCAGRPEGRDCQP
ncbi:GIY-YIG nuclease family protein [Sphingomonas sp. AAP5]|uniref:GIY-YIG nuclease family protein n=1 Tax=Sphingomonas sp. AAP5 TaxID=1523415 RepID=UPI0010575E85|nr:GIY-YIG nuclease family protein [Sphingomonas sp. AAP5]QBM77797.1 GIY-YIG nuclease family protein [Sphingomonas sp. AAP5]